MESMKVIQFHGQGLNFHVNNQNINDDTMGLVVLL